MPSGIILSSGSQGATQEAIEKVLNDNGYEADKPDPQPEPELAEPKREAFASDEEFEQAQEEYESKLEEQEEEREAGEEKKRLAALPKKSRRQRAIEKATSELNRKLEEANARLAALEGKKPGAEKTEPAIEAPKQPKREDFKSDAEFEDALFDYRYKLRRAKEDAEAQTKAVQERLKANAEAYRDNISEFKEENSISDADWKKAVDQPIPIHPGVYVAIMELENGAAVTYYLGTHPDFVKKLAELSEPSAVMEIGRLSAKLTRRAEPTGDKPKPKPRAAIPEPIKPAPTSATASTVTSRDAAKSRDYRAFKAAQRAGR